MNSIKEWYQKTKAWFLLQPKYVQYPILVGVGFVIGVIAV